MIYFTCLGRGPHMFGDQSAELAAIQDELGEVPLVGFFCTARFRTTASTATPACCRCSCETRMTKGAANP